MRGEEADKVEVYRVSRLRRSTPTSLPDLKTGTMGIFKYGKWTGDLTRQWRPYGAGACLW